MRRGELLIPIGSLLVLACMLFPLPTILLDGLLVINVVLALSLFLSTLYINEPLKLSSLPSILLMATMFRLALNIATTRSILGAGEGGKMIASVGQVVIQGNLAVGVVVFLIITLVQFIVIAKGSERVAEVSARFALDALPGKQMSIDADVRAGLIDFDAARQKRQGLQVESKFYGALDGAMKFVKGDAIAGLIVTAINIIGGLIIGIFWFDLDLGTAAHKYTLLTIGEGLLAQIPALLNALASGMVVTRVAREDGDSLASEVMAQMSQSRRVKQIIAGVALLLAFLPGLPFLPFIALAALSVLSAFQQSRLEKLPLQEPIRFRPRAIPVLSIEIDRALAAGINQAALMDTLESFRERVFEERGLLLLAPQVSVKENLGVNVAVRIRGIQVAEIRAVASTGSSGGTGTPFLATIGAELYEIVIARAAEFIDDILTRRTLDHFDREAPELVSAVVPTLVSVTQLSEILRGLVSESVSIRNFDVILQAVAEHGPRTSSTRALLEDVRIALKRLISQQIAKGQKQLTAVSLQPVIDLMLVRAERDGEVMNPEHIERIVAELSAFQNGIDASEPAVVCSRGARRLLQQCLGLRRIKNPVIAIEELADDLELRVVGTIGTDIEEEESDEILERLAA